MPSFVKSLLLLVTVAIMAVSKVNAQVDINIGTGTVGNTGTVYPCPLQDHYEGSKAQYLYRASELLAAGMVPGTISAIKFEVTTLNTFTGDIEDMQIKIGGTAAAALTNAWETTNSVFGPVNFVPVVGVNTFTLSTPFFWNGSDNIVVEVCNGQAGNVVGTHWTQNVTVPWTTGLSFNASHTYRLDDNDNLCGAAANADNGLGSQTTRPNITFAWTAAAACSGTPVAGTAVSTQTTNVCTYTPITLSLSGNTLASGLTYEWQYSTNNTTWNPLPATSPSYTTTPSAGNNYYRCKVTCTTGGANSTSSSVLVTGIVCPPVYCATTYGTGTGSGDYCSLVQIPGTSLNNPTPAAPAPYYTLYPQSGSTTGVFVPGQSYTINLVAGTFAGDDFAAWIDYNQNGTFESSELLGNALGVGASPAVTTFSFTVPPGALPGTARLRVRVADQSVDAILNPCGNYTWGEVEDYDVTIVSLVPCAGTPVAGTTTASTTNVTCPGTPITLGLSGNTINAGLMHQWQTGPSGTGPWTNVGTASPFGLSYTTIQTAPVVYYQCVITCTNGGATSTSTPIMVTAIAQAYTTIPYTESFESNWLNGCSTSDIPQAFWKNTPATGNGSWRREDDGASAAWTNVANGIYTPASSVGAHSARFHSYGASTGTIGNLDLFIDCNTPDLTKRIDFDYINTNGNDSIAIMVSTDGGSNFFRIDSVKSGSTGWRTKTAYFNSTSAITVIRFMAYGINNVGTDMGIDNLKVNNFPNCTGTPTPGVAAATSTNITCPGDAVTLFLTGTTVAGALSYQWQSSLNGTSGWTNIPTANSPSYTTVQGVPTLFYQCVVTCNNGGGFSTSNAVQVNAVPQQYATIPYTQSFEGQWLTRCASNDVPDNFWKNTPSSNTALTYDPDASWRREDDGVSAGWTTPASGAYTPTGSDGVHSARFHTFWASAQTMSTFDLFVNCNTSDPSKRLDFDYMNQTGNDSLVIELSTNGGTSFTRIDSLKSGSPSWRPKAIFFTTSSPTVVIRFRAVSLFGSGTQEDIGIDNIRVNNFPNCSGTPTAGTAVTSQSILLCTGAQFTLSLTGTTVAAGLTYQWQSGPSATGPWTNLPTASTNPTYTGTQTAAAVYYRCEVKCSFNNVTNPSSSVLITNVLTQPYATLPYAESFESNWINGCGTRELPNQYWKNTPITGNNSWRREDDGLSAWTAVGGAYTPAASDGFHSARFHTDGATSGTFGTLDLFVNCLVAAPIKRLQFDYINTSIVSQTNYDHDSIFVSTDGGASFIFLDTAGLATVWTNKTLFFTSLSATTVIRFKARSDFGVTDMGLDNIKINAWPNCNGKPVAGIATANPPSNACLTTPLTLNAPNASVGNGILYQWYQSTNGGTTWSVVPGNSANQSITILQSVTTQYRMIIKCVFSNQFDTSSIVSVSSPNLPGGNYTINANFPTLWSGSSGNFASFKDAYDAMKCGITAPTTFTVLSGLAINGGAYPEQLIITGVIPNSSAVNKITFKGNGQTIKFGSGNSNERAVIKLRNTKHFTFDGLNIDATGGTYGFGVHLISDADSNTIKNCTINNTITAGSTNYAGIVISALDASATGTGTTTGICDYNKIDSNTVIGGYYGITQAATFAGGAHGFNQITNNKVTDFYLYGIYVNSTYNTVIEGNTMSRPNIPAVNLTTCYGIYFTGQSNSALVSKNKITNPFAKDLASTSTFGGIYFTGVAATAGLPNIVRNNLIYGINGQGLIYGMYNSGSSNVGYFHNTVSLDSTAAAGTSSAYGFFQTGTSNSISFVDNLISVTRGGTAAKYAVNITTPFSSANNNNYFVGTGATFNVGFLTSARVTLADWKTATAPFGIEQNSVSVNPAFAGSSYVNADYHPTNAALDNRGIYIGVTDDITGLVRSTSTPDIGAYEFIPIGCTTPLAPATTVIGTGTCESQLVPFNVSMGIYGSGQTFQWQYSTTNSGPWTNIGNLMTHPDTSFFAVGGPKYYQCLIKCGTATTTSNPVLLTVGYALQAGTYKINASSTVVPAVPAVPGVTIFRSFAEAKAAMACGVTGTGNVIFNVEANATNNGIYVETLKLDSIPGVNASRQIIFNGNGNTIAMPTAGPTTNERAVIKLNGADYITFDSLRINSITTAATYTHGVHLLNNADSNTFRRCVILASQTVAQSNTAFAAVVINATDATTTTAVTTAASMCDGNLFDRDSISGGYYGLTIVGGTTLATSVANNRFTNNYIADFYTYGLYASGTYNTLIEGNTFTRPNRAAVIAANAIYLTTNPSLRMSISKNRITKMFGGPGASTNTGGLYGIYINSVDAQTGNEITVSNNLLYNLDGAGPIYGMYNVGSDNVFYYHNTISIDQQITAGAVASVGMYQTTNAIGVKFKNNIVTIRRPTTGLKQGIYLFAATTDVESDYNDIYITGNGTNIFGSIGTTNYPTLAAWKAATLEDVNSYSLEPFYLDTLNGNYRPNTVAIDNKGISFGITSDIVNGTRSLFTPDLGAYEFTPLPCVNPPVPGTAVVVIPNPNTGICLEQPIRLNVINSSPMGSLKFQWQSSPTGNANTWTNLGPVLYNPMYDTVSSINRFYRCIVQCGNGTQTVTNTVSIVLNNLLPAGTYYISTTGLEPLAPVGGPYTSGQRFTTVQAAVTAVSCGISGHIAFEVTGTFNEQIRIPYVPGGNANATVTFRSKDGNPANAVLTTAGSGTNNYTLQLDSARYFFFRNMTFTNTNVTNGRVVELRNGAFRDSITNCVINTPVTTSTTNANAAVYINGLRGTNNVIKGNTINNGSNGIYIVGVSPAVPILDHLVDSNTINNPYVNGIYATEWQGIKATRNTINLAAPLTTIAYGIYANNCDSSLLITNNKVNIASSAATSTVHGIYVGNSDNTALNRGLLTGNDIVAKAANAGSLYGITVGGNTAAAPSPFISVLNNTVVLKTSGAQAFGIYHGNSPNANYYNNSVNSLATSATNNFAAYFNNTTATTININNNIFSHKGIGTPMYLAVSAGALSNYNMLYTTGPTLVRCGTPAGSFATLGAWNLANFQDLFSMVYSPAFVNDSTLRPDLSNPDVWAIHGRGVQIAGNNYDHDNASRPTTLTTGVPDLGAYEFYPVAQPTVLTAIPAAPAPNTVQAFMYGTDTVMKIKWRNTAPPSLTIRRFSGVVPSGVTAQNLDSMYFYTQVDIPGGGTYNYDARLFYVDSWLGSIGNVPNGTYQLGLGKTTAAVGNPWIVGFSSRNLPTKRMIYEDSLTANLDKFTGLINPYAPPVLPDQDTSNAGKRFYVAYPINQLDGGSNQQMTLYLSAGASQAHVQVKIGGTTYVRDYIVPANSVLATATTTNPDYIPKAGPQNAFLNASGIYDQTIRIESDEPIVAYAHVTGSASSGAAMLMPVGTWGYEYKTLCIEGSGGYGDAYPYFYIVADNDNTLVQVTPNGPVTNPGMTPNTVNMITLNRGQVALIVGTNTTEVMTGSVVKSVPNSAGKCYPVAVFSGHSRMTINISGSGGSGGDFMMQQNFPSTAWGKRYLTAPTSSSTNASALATNVFRVAVKDPTTVVKLNGNILGPLYNNHYYEYTSNTADLIEADKPVTVAQFTGGGSAVGLNGSNGDPEMMYISPIEQRVKKVSFYRNNVQQIDANLLTMIIPTNGLASLVIRDGINPPTNPDYVYPHPQNGLPALRGVNYSVVVKRWPATQSQVTVESDSSFTGITYGLGSVESYGYNMGTLIKNLGVRNDTLINNPPPPTPSLYNCVGTPFKVRVRTSIIPTTMKWLFSQVPFITPKKDTTVVNPVPTNVTYDSNGEPVYTFTLDKLYTFSQAGFYSIPVVITHPDIESCDNSLTSLLNVWVLPAPNVGFQVSFAGCQNNTATFTADGATPSGIAANTWTWNFQDGTHASGPTATFTYPNAGTFYDTLHVVTADGCIRDTVRATVVNPLPIVSVATDSLAICPGGSASYTATTQLTGGTYAWYTSATGGTPLVTGGNYTISATGNTITVTNVTVPTQLWVQATSTSNCVSSVRKRVVINVLPPLASPVVSVSTRAVNAVTFTWPAVSNVANYQVSVNGGPFIAVSGPGLSHTVTGLGILDSARVVVRANGLITCQNSLSNSIKGCSDSQPGVATDSIAVCVNNAPVTPFTIQPQPANITYSWYNALTNGTLLGSGSTYNPGAISTPLTSYSYYVQHTNLVTGCVSSLPRTRVALNVLAPLAKAVVTVDTLTGITPTSLIFQWAAVPGAVGGYQISVNGGAFITPSTGTFGLSHTVSGLLPNTSVTVVVKAIGYLPCQESISNARTSKTYTDVVYIPNAFNPNSGDVRNRTLRVEGYVIKTMNFMVFNQWGEKVFETTNQSIGWDGNYKGKPLPSGVYIYVMRWTHINGSSNENKGSISLIR
jgi:gliding motility-associated-like protein